MRYYLFLALLLWPSLAFSHPFHLGSLRIQVPENRLKVSLLLPTALAQRLAGWVSVPGSPEALDERTAALFAGTLAPTAPALRGKSCFWQEPVALFVGKARQFVELSASARCPGSKEPFRLEWELPFLDRTPPDFNLMVHVERWEENSSFSVGRAQPRISMGKSTPPAFGAFFRIGVAHIGAWPSEWYSPGLGLHLPEGIDHICFVLALLVAGGVFWEVLRNVTGFTLGHSLTLGLSAYGMVHVNARFVEACVALSIAFMAGSSLWRKGRSHGWIVAFAFGTVHGLAFASALNELGLERPQIFRALLGFNLGVEAGQCLILLAAMPVLAVVRLVSERAYRHVLTGLAVILLGVGLLWFAQRISGV